VSLASYRRHQRPGIERSRRLTGRNDLGAIGGLDRDPVTGVVPPRKVRANPLRDRGAGRATEQQHQGRARVLAVGVVLLDRRDDAIADPLDDGPAQPLDGSVRLGPTQAIERDANTWLHSIHGPSSSSPHLRLREASTSGGSYHDPRWLDSRQARAIRLRASSCVSRP
jgi:hypothetical protein